MNYLDIIILIIFALGFIIGFKNGLIKKIITLAMFILAIIISISFSSEIKKVVQSLLSLDEYSSVILSFILIFVVMAILGTLLIKIFNLKKGVTGLINKIAGGIIGFVQYGLILSAILIFLKLFSFPNESTKEKSLFYNFSFKFIPTTFFFIEKIFPATKDFFKSMENVPNKIKSYNV